MESLAPIVALAFMSVLLLLVPVGASILLFALALGKMRGVTLPSWRKALYGILGGILLIGSLVFVIEAVRQTYVVCAESGGVIRAGDNPQMLGANRFKPSVFCLNKDGLVIRYPIRVFGVTLF